MLYVFLAAIMRLHSVSFICYGEKHYVSQQSLYYTHSRSTSLQSAMTDRPDCTHGQMLYPSMPNMDG